MGAAEGWADLHLVNVGLAPFWALCISFFVVSIVSQHLGKAAKDTPRAHVFACTTALLPLPQSAGPLHHSPSIVSTASWQSPPCCLLG
jgi:hypothetical protein